MAQLFGREYQLGTLGFSVSATGMVPYEFTSHNTINYKRGRPVVFTKNHKGTQMGHTIGDEDTSGASVTVLMSEWEAFMVVVEAAFPLRDLSTIEFNGTVNLGEQSAGTLKTDILEGLFFTEEARSAQTGQEAMSMPVPIAIKHVYMNGRRPNY